MNGMVKDSTSMRAEYTLKQSVELNGENVIPLCVCERSIERKGKMMLDTEFFPHLFVNQRRSRAERLGTDLPAKDI